MALTYVKNAKVARVFFDGRGVEVHETFKKQDGTEGVQKITAWFQEAPGLSEGDIVNVSGLTGVKARLWERDGEPPVPMADLVLNSARFEYGDAPEETTDDTPW